MGGQTWMESVMHYIKWTASLLVAGLLGFGIGRAVNGVVEAQSTLILQASDSSSGSAATIQTDGNNALKVIGK